MKQTSITHFKSHYSLRVLIALFLVIASSLFVSAQLTGIKTIPGNYPTIAIAVDSLNAFGVGPGGVIFNVASNYTETISATIALTATGTAANPVVFQKDSATTGANPLITAYTGGTGTPSTALQDGIWRLSGSDYVTINAIDLKENPANTTNPSTMEYGYALYKAGPSNGCQYITIKNCVITLNNLNNALGSGPMVDGSTGIAMMNALATTAATAVTVIAGGTHSNNKFYSNIIQNCNTGIALIGYVASAPFTLADANNDIGGASGTTGNTIINYGGSAGAINPAVAIRTLAQYGLNVSYNVINSNNGGGTNHSSALRGIFINSATSASATITYNTVTLKGGGTTQVVTGIENASGSTPAGNTITINNNTIKNSTYTSATTGSLYGIYNYGTPATLTINNDTISNNSSSASTTGVFYEVYNTGAASSVSISNNKLSGNSTGISTGSFAGILNSAATPLLNINNNTLAGDSTATITGLHYSIYNSGTVTSAININANNIGTGVSPAIKFTAANSGGHTFIINTKGSAAAALSISNNNFFNVLYSTGGTGANTYISNTAATLSQAINGNTFTNLNVNTTSNIIFISNSVIVSGTGTQDVNNNSISGTFTKAAGGTVTLFTSGAASLAGSIINNNNNNFSNITVTGNTPIAGWVNTDAGNSTKTIQNNIFSNWAGGTGAITALSVSLTGANNATTGNAINNISGGGSVTGIATGVGRDNIFANTINSLTSTGGTTTTVSGISVSSGTLKNIYLNTIYNLQANSLTTGSVRGIVITGGIAVNAYQNTIYTLQANAITTGTISGLWIAGGTTVVAYRNKIYDLSSSGSAISTGTVNGIQVSGSTISTITLRNNLVGDLRASAASAPDPIRGMSIISTGTNSTVNVYNNTINLNATSTGANFGSSGIYHLTNAIATTATLDLRNNIITNNSVPTGTAFTVAFRRLNTTLANYAVTSNNNLFYAGLATAKRVIFYDGINADPFLSIYKSRVAARDAQSVTEDLTGTAKFISTIGSSASFLHLDSTKTSQVESGGGSITSVTNDYDGQIRQGATGYTGTGTAPDIGADEFEGTISSALAGTYNVGAGQTYTSLTNAGGLFAGINSLGLSGNVIVNITSDLTEDGTNVLYQWVEKGVGNYTLTIQPNASAVRVISGNVLTAMIGFNGAKRVTIDGSNGTPNNYLTFRNTNTTGTTGAAFTFINGTANNTIKYCNIEAFANATNGVMLFGPSTVIGGNSNNTISNCNINATVAANSGSVGIYSAGTAGNENAANSIINNKIFNYRDKAIDITATGSRGWNISANSLYNGDVSGSTYAPVSTLYGIRILGGSGYTISNNYIGGNAPLASGTMAGYSSTGILSFQAILLTTSGAVPASFITGNTIANISVSAVPTVAASANVFIGIETNGSGINIGGLSPGNGNMIGSNTNNGFIAITTTTTSTSFLSLIKGINCNSTGGLVIGNQVAGIDINNVGSSPGASTFNGIYINNATAPTQINNNIIGSTGSGAATNSIRVLATSTSTTTLVTGIAVGSSVVSAVQLDGNTIKNVSFLSASTSTLTGGGIIGISSAATGAASVTITNNTITKDSIATFSTGWFFGIYNSGSSAIISINNNILIANSTNSTSGVYYAIYNNGAVTAAININNNNIGNSTAGAFTFNAVNSGTQIFINNAQGTSTAALSVSNNDFQGINYVAAGTGNNTYIQNSFATLSQTINGNTFTNLNINTTGNVTFISDNVAVPATGTQNVNNNSIVTGFTKKAGNIITLFTNLTSSAAGSIINNNSNNFSNITVLGATTISGWINTDAGSSTKTIQNNIFSNWIGGTNNITALAVNVSGSNNVTSGNLINNISGAGAITGITTGTGNDNIFANTINTLSSTAALAVTGIAITAGGTLKNIYKNKIYDLSGSNSGSTINGILVSGGTTVNIFNNLVGDLRAVNGSNADPIRGINITSTVAPSSINVYYNTIYINASSSSGFFGTTGIYHTASTTATTATLDLRNNSITNTSTFKGAGYIVAFRRSSSSAALSNYASTSNNNMFFAGIPSASKLIYRDSSTGDPTLALYKSRVSARDASSISEDVTGKFLSTTGSSSVFLHMSSLIATAVESGGANITGFTLDVDGQIRAGNTGYTGSSTLPDIGADEIFGIETVPPTITYTLLSNTTIVTNRNVTGVTITDASGISNMAGTNPRIYYKRSTDANVWLDNTSATNGWKYTEATNSSSPYTFTIDYSLLNGGAAVIAGAIQYFIVAQDLATTANVAINSGTFAATPASVALTSTAFPISGAINSYNIAFAGTYNVGATEIFTSLTKTNGLFASINNAGLMGNATFIITSNLAEDGTNALNQWNELGSGNYTLTIQPDAATLRTISGNVPAGLIRFNGTDRVTIDGSISGTGKYLSFKNTNATATTGTAFTFNNGATNNSIRNCDAQAAADAADGVILFGASSVAGGNSNNVIDNNTINSTVAALTGNVAIYSAGTGGNENSSNTISTNIVYGYRDRGLDITATGSTAWTVSGNSFYNGNVTGAINYASTALHGIRILGGSGYSILNNYIGGSAALASGANAIYSSNSGNLSYQGILLTTNSASPVSNIKGNTVASIALSTVPTAPNSASFTGIETNGSGITIGGSAASEGNSVGSSASNGSIVVTTSTANAVYTTNINGINCTSSGGTVSNNRVSGFDISNIGASPAPSYFQGIYVSNAAAPAQLDNNLIGSTSITNNIRVLPASTSASTSITAIGIGAAINTAIQVNDNRIENIGNLSTTSSGSFVGINNAASGSPVISISSDTIQNVNAAANTNAASAVYAGIISGSASSINNNFINNFTLASTGINAQIQGINVSGNYANTVSGNIISNLSTASNKVTAGAENGTPASSAIIGILNSTTAAGQVINNNRFSGFNATSTAAVNVGITGIGITSTGSGNILSNRFGTFTNTTTGSGPVICHIMAANGSFNVYNNILRLSNLTNTNGIKIYGIIHAAAASWNYFHNTVRLSGSSNGTALRSAAFLLSGNSSPVLKNNILFNIRTGTGSHYAVSNLAPPSGTWSSTASDYNDLYSTNPNTVAEWGNASGKTFAQWQSLTGGDAHSITDAISFIISTYDLEPDSVSNCAFDNAGTPITAPIIVNTDINNKPRNAVTPDLGAYEFSYTGFTIIAGNNSPVCAGDSVTLTADPGNTISPNFVWRNPANVVVSTLQNPTLLISATGKYKVTITDSTGCNAMDSTLVTVNQRPTANITSQTSLCDSGFVNLNIAVTGTGTFYGTLSNGDIFSGTAPLIPVMVNVTGTTSFSIISLYDSLCTATPADLPDTVTIMVTHKGDWLGVNSNWSNPVNWCGGILPTSTTDVTIPAGTSIMPIVSDSAYANSLLISSGDTLTIIGTGNLFIAGTLTNNGFYKDNGTTTFNGTSGQQTFSGITTFNNLTLNNTGGLLLPAAITVNNNLTISAGTLNAFNFNISIKGNWINNVSITAFTAGTGTVTFNGTTAQTIAGTFATHFNNFTISNTITVSLGINAVVSGNLSVSAGTFDLGAFTANRSSAGGTLTVANNATLKIGGTNTYPANYATNILVVASTVEYSGTNQAVANQPYGNLTVSSSGGAAIKTFPGTALTVAGNLTSTLGGGTSVTFTAPANIAVNGNVSIGALTTFNGGSYSHSIGGNWTNSGTFNGNTSTVIFTGAGTLVGGTGTQNFNNLTIAASGINFSSNSITLTGNLATILSGSFTQTSGGTLLISGIGKTISGPAIILNNLTVSGSVTASNSFNIIGNLAVSGSFSGGTSTITMSGISKTISGSGSILFYILNSTGSITSTANFSIASSLLVNGSFTSSEGTATFTGTSSLSGTANLYTVIINGTSLQLSAGSQLGIANTLTLISGILNVTTSGPNTVNFNGAGAQNVNAITYSNLVMSNGNTKTAVGNITTNYDITIGTGTTFNASSYTISVYGNWVNNGTFNSGTSNVQFVGPATAYISGITAFNILTSNTSSATTKLFLNNSISAVTVEMTKGIIETGLDTLTIFGTRNGNGYIFGNIRRTHTFLTGVAYAFEGPDNTITFSSVSSVTSITVSVVEGSISDFPFGSSISRLYNINVPTGTYNATLRLHYEDDELNGIDEATMGLWHYNGSIWSSAGKTGNSTTSDYVELSGLTNITNRWTASSAQNLVQWNGSVSTDWNTAANWTVLQGSGSRPPSSTDIVDLGTATFVNQPAITNGVTVKNIIFGSVQAVTLTLGSGGSLTTLGNVNGTWAGSVAHSIKVNNQYLTVNGDLNLSDGTNGHAINLNIGTGTVTTANSLTESGNANITFTGAGSLNIFGDFNYSSGTFTAGSGTVTYNGTENQEVAGVDYNNLTIIKAGGLAEINDTVNVAGNLLDSLGQLDNHSLTTISGNVTISASGAIYNYQTLHVRGNWNNNGTSAAIGSSVYFDGAGSQSISSTTFNNLIINKPSGIATLTGNVTLTGDLTISSGTFDIWTYVFDRNLPGGTASTSNGATFMIGANNPPRNFTNNIIGPSSTTIFYGPSPLFIGLAGITFGNLIFRGTGLKTVLEDMTVKGDLTIDSLSSFDATSATVSLNGNWINSGTFIPSASTLLLNGIAKTITGNTTFNRAIAAGSYTLLNDITFDSSITINSTGAIYNGVGKTVTLNGDYTSHGLYNIAGTSTFTGTRVQTINSVNATTSVFIQNYNGTISPVITSTASPQFQYLNINNTGGVSPLVKWTVHKLFTVGFDAIWNGGASSHDFFGDVTNNGTITSAGTLSFLPATAATVNLGTNFSSTGRVYFGGAGAITLAGTPVSFNNVNINNTNAAGIIPSSDWNVTKDLRIVSGSILYAGNHNYLVGGNITNNGIINSGTSIFTLNGRGIQNIINLSPFNNLTINKSAGATIQSSNVVVNGILNFVSGQIQTGSYILQQPLGGTVTGAAQNTGWVNGNLEKSIPAGSNVSRTFETGDANYYTPATVLFASVSSGGDLTVNSTPSEHSQIDLSGLNKNLDVNRYWTLTNTGIAFTTAASTFIWVAPDVDAGAVTTKFKISEYNGTIWGFTSYASPLATSIQATGLTSFGSFAIGEGYKNVIWTGAAGTADWFTAANWYGSVPDTTVETIIPALLQNGRLFPLLHSGIATIDSVTIQTGASLTVANSTLRIKGAITNNGTFDASSGTIEMNGANPQTISINSFTNNTVLNLVISNNVTLAGQINLMGLLSFGNTNGSTLTANGFLTLTSTDIATARVGDITNGGANNGNSISGLVTVERYFMSKRAFRFLTAPVNTLGSIRANWMENTNNPTIYVNNNPVPGYGTHITGTGGGTNGFDATISNNPSLFTYNNQMQIWIPVLNTDSLLKAGQAFRILDRGSRSTILTSNTSVSSPTTVRTKGTLVTGTIILKSAGQGGTPGMPELSAATNGYSFVANPYASPVDWLLVDLNNISGTMYIFDPAINGANGRGGYVAFNRSIGPSGVSSNDSSKIDNNIQSGQAFFTQTTAGDPSLTFKETYKTSVNRQVFRDPHPIAKMSLQLLLPQQQIAGGAADALALYFSNSFSQSIGNEDSYKFTNQDENIAILRDGKTLSIEGRKLVTANDTVPLKIWQLTAKNYILKITINNFDNNVEGYLEDEFTHTTTKLFNETSTMVPFAITSDTLSAALQRFRIVFKNAGIVLSEQPLFKAYKKEKGVQVEWITKSIENTDSCVVEKSDDAQKFNSEYAEKVKDRPSLPSAHYWFDANPLTGYNYYRMRFINEQSETNYSKIVKVFFADNAGSIVVFPNPVEKNVLNIQFTKMMKGDYVLKLFTLLGQEIYTSKITHSIYSSNHTVKINTLIAKGLYQLQLTSGSTKLNTKVFFK